MERPEEIGLVDLAAMVVIDRMVAITVFILTVLVGISYILMTPDLYQYRSLVQVAQKQGGEPVQSAEYLVPKLEKFWLPQLENEYQDNGEAFSGKPSLSYSAASSMIEFWSVAGSDDEKLVREIHQKLIDQLLDEQNEYFADEKQSLKDQLDSQDALIERISGFDNGQFAAVALEVRNDLKRQFDGLQPAVVLTELRRSSEPQRRPAWQLMAGFIAAGIVLGIVAAFLAAFLARVRAKLR
jgi:uncharacterized protein involved in exopolysaccharide biosynthesis